MKRYASHVMGMPISLAMRGRHAEDERAWERVMDSLREADEVFSTYREASFISRLDRGEVTLTQCPPEVAEVFALGRAASIASDGAFSIWRPGLDPSGVVKGWAVERAAQYLRELPDTDFCLSAGGDMVCHAHDAPWRVGIEDPHDPGRLVAIVSVRRGAVATTGTAHRGEHLIDARDGSLPQGVASITVVGPSLTWADIDATAAYALGQRAAAWLTTRPLRTGLVVWADGTAEVVSGPGPRISAVTTAA